MIGGDPHLLFELQGEGGDGIGVSGSSVMVLPFFSLLIKDLFFLKEAAASRYAK